MLIPPPPDRTGDNRGFLDRPSGILHQDRVPLVTCDSTDMLGERLAELQVTLGEGPCVDVRRDGGPVFVADLDAPIRVGVLALHRVLAGQLGSATLTDSLAFAELALGLLLDEQAGLPATAGDAALTGGLPLHSPQVHQATGMISAQLEVGMEDAFARLRARAFAQRRPLAELAADVVARRLRFDPPDEAP